MAQLAKVRLPQQCEQHHGLACMHAAACGWRTAERVHERAARAGSHISPRVRECNVIVGRVRPCLVHAPYSSVAPPGELRHPRSLQGPT